MAKKRIPATAPRKSDVIREILKSQPKATVKEVRGEHSLVEITVRVEWAEGAYALTERRFRPTIVSGIATR